jgi:hypothetical protein
MNQGTPVNDSLVTHLASFAVPGSTFDEDFAEELAVTHARQTILRLLVRHPDAFEELGSTVADTVRLAASGPLNLNDVWCRPIGAAWANLRSDPAYPAQRAARLLAEWAAMKLLVPQDTDFEGMPVFRGKYRICIRYRESLSTDDPVRADAISSEEHASVTTLLQESFDVIDRFAPEFGPWTLRLLRDIIPLDSAADCMRSGSSVAEPGSCHMSFRAGPVALAEMLVHETTHQYYYLATRCGPVDDGTDQQLYYSPAKECGRPIHYILIAYHAFANVLLFSHRCLAEGNEDTDGYLRRNVKSLTAWIRTFEEALQATNALTDCGRALWLPLARKLRRHNVLADQPPGIAETLASHSG